MRTSNTLDRETTTIPFSTAALKANLLRLENEWEAYQVTRERDAVYVYLSLVFQTVAWWAKGGKAVKRAHRAVCSSSRATQLATYRPKPAFCAPKSIL